MNCCGRRSSGTSPRQEVAYTAHSREMNASDAERDTRRRLVKPVGLAAMTATLVWTAEIEG